MSGDRGCIAGITPQGESIRPMLQGGIYLRHLLPPIVPAVVRPRAVFEMSLSPAAELIAPHLEDHDWDIEAGVDFVQLASEALWRLALDKVRKASVEAVFGVELHRNKNLQPDTGTSSLGVIKAHSVDEVECQYAAAYQKREFRISFTDENGTVYDKIPITDLGFKRYYAARLNTQKPDQIAQDLQRRLSGQTVYLRLGVGRPYAGWCWLQVNGIYTFPDYLNGRCFADFLNIV
jgi:hypothetical protein